MTMTRPRRAVQKEGRSEIILLHVLHVFDDHERDLECDGILKDTQIQACALLEFIQPVDQRIPVDEELT